MDSTSATCNDGSSPSNISLSTGEFVQCVFTNQKRGTITVVQDTSPDGPQDFSYTAPGLTPNSFQLDDDGDNSNALSNTRTYSNLNSGTYAISQTTVPGRLLEQATCSDGSSPSSINLGIGEDVTCTFVNSQRGKIVVRKDAQPDHFQDFSFTTGGGFSRELVPARRRRQRGEPAAQQPHVPSSTRAADTPFPRTRRRLPGRWIRDLQRRLPGLNIDARRARR